MSQVSKVLRSVSGGYAHWCPACERMHILPNGWNFDHNFERPTFSPSFKHGRRRIETFEGKWTGRWKRGLDGEPLDGTCHYIVTDGRIQYCPDSWHGRSDIIDMPELPEFVSDFGQRD